MRVLLICLGIAVGAVVPVGADGEDPLASGLFADLTPISGVSATDFAPAVFAPGVNSGGAGASLSAPCECFPYCACGATCSNTVIGCECVAASEFEQCWINNCDIQISC